MTVTHAVTKPSLARVGARAGAPNPSRPVLEHFKNLNPKAVAVDAATANGTHNVDHPETNGPGIDIDRANNLVTQTTATLRRP